MIWGAVHQFSNRHNLDFVKTGKNHSHGRLICERGLPVMFTRKKDMAQYISIRYGYIANRKDLRAYPHGWRMPKIVKVKVEVKK